MLYVLTLQLREKKELVKLGMSESVDLWFVRERGRKSYASLITRPGDEEHAIDLAVSNGVWLHEKCVCMWPCLRA